MDSTPSQSPQDQQSQVAKITNQVKDFYKQEFTALVKCFFMRPIGGLLETFQGATEVVYKNSLILFGSVFVAYLFGVFILAGSDISFGNALKLALTPVIMMIVVSAISFGIKSISGKPDFKRELLTGGLCALPLALLLVCMIFIRFFVVDDMTSFLMDPAGSLVRVGIVGLVVILYVLLMLFNVFQQSLKAADTNDALAYYLSPAAILIAIYLTVRIVIELL
jgi:hypothetical protein